MPARVELGIHGHALVTVAAWDPHIPATVSLDFLPPEAVTRLRAGDTEVVVEVVTDLGATNADDAVIEILGCLRVPTDAMFTRPNDSSNSSTRRVWHDRSMTSQKRAQTGNGTPGSFAPASTASDTSAAAGRGYGDTPVDPSPEAHAASPGGKKSFEEIMAEIDQRVSPDKKSFEEIMAEIDQRVSPDKKSFEESRAKISRQLGAPPPKKRERDLDPPAPWGMSERAMTDKERADHIRSISKRISSTGLPEHRALMVVSRLETMTGKMDSRASVREAVEGIVRARDTHSAAPSEQTRAALDQAVSSFTEIGQTRHARDVFHVAATTIADAPKAP